MMPSFPVYTICGDDIGLVKHRQLRPVGAQQLAYRWLQFHKPLASVKYSTIA